MNRRIGFNLSYNRDNIEDEEIRCHQTCNQKHAEQLKYVKKIRYQFLSYYESPRPGTMSAIRSFSGSFLRMVNLAVTRNHYSESEERLKCLFRR